jgi:hypothetical protein
MLTGNQADNNNLSPKTDAPYSRKHVGGGASFKEGVMDLFGLGMLGNYEDRKIENTETEDFVVDTCAITDDPTANYETGIKSRFYNDGKWIIVETYQTGDEALAGHRRWVAEMKRKPAKLVDIGNANIRQLADAFANPEDWEYERQEVEA